MLHTRESIIPNQVVIRYSSLQTLANPPLPGYLGQVCDPSMTISHADKGIRYSSLQTLANPPLPGYLGQVCDPSMTISHADKGIRYSSLQTLANRPLPGYLSQGLQWSEQHPALYPTHWLSSLSVGLYSRHSSLRNTFKSSHKNCLRWPKKFCCNILSFVCIKDLQIDKMSR